MKGLLTIKHLKLETGLWQHKEVAYAMWESWNTLVTTVTDAIWQTSDQKSEAEQMLELLSFLKDALVHNGPLWPHMPSESDVVVERLRLMAKVLQAGRADGNVVAAFTENQGQGIGAG